MFHTFYQLTSILKYRKKQSNIISIIMRLCVFFVHLCILFSNLIPFIFISNKGNQDLVQLVILIDEYNNVNRMALEY